MTLTHFKKYSLRAIFMLPLIAGMQATPALAQSAPKAAPAATTTLDICHNTATGNWRYSGMVSLSGAAVRNGSAVGIDYLVQNKTSALGFADALRAPPLADGAALPAADGRRLARFSVEAAPLLLGTLRSSAQIRIVDLLAPASAPLLLAPGSLFMASVCGCEHPKGCTRTQGYWGNKPNLDWPGAHERGDIFFSSGLSWQDLFDTSSQGGNGYVILAHQYMAAVLNIAAGASAPASILAVLADARAYFNSGATLDSCANSACETQKTWAGILDTYNNGLYPGAPKACPD